MFGINFDKPHPIPPSNNRSMQGSGIFFKGRRFITHTTLNHENTAFFSLVLWQKLFLGTIVALMLYGLITSPIKTSVEIVAVLSTIYFFDVIFNLFLIVKSLRSTPEIKFTVEEISKLHDDELPVYTILCPLYKEAKVVPRFIKAIEKIDWPKEKLEVIILIEENDPQTKEALLNTYLPDNVGISVVPYSIPKTKPKACNWGLSLAQGDYLVIYDAEDEPEPLQLKKAYVAFNKVPSDVICLQSKLNYYNPHQNVLTRLFTAEYSLWFDIILTGLQKMNTVIPLGGTSNHFKRADLIKLEGWDAFNVTEDADLGIRLFKAGYKTAIIDSTTYEEANSELGNWVRQRSRWIKGYIQTYFVHMREPAKFFREYDLHALVFQLLMGGKIAFCIINPLLWLMTISYFALNGITAPIIETLYPSHIFYMALTSFVFGNFMFFYCHMIGCAKRSQWTLLKYLILVPFYWLLISAATLLAIYQFIVKPHFWEKTVHGLDLRSTNNTNQPVESTTLWRPI